MARNEAFREAERKIKEAGQSGERSLDLAFSVTERIFQNSPNCRRHWANSVS